jgi:hypothetical protein
VAHRSSVPAPALLAFVASVAFACGSGEHPPPIGDGGRTVQGPPIINEFGGTSSNGGTSSQGGSTLANGGVPISLAGSSSGDSSFGGTVSLGGTSSSIAGDAAIGGNGSAGVLSFSGSFSTGGL